MKTEDVSRVNQSEFSQPLCTAVQIILVNLLRLWAISPVAVIGHSSGEIAAAYACGALTLQEAIVVAYLRGLASTKRTIPSGAMAAIGLGREEVKPYLIHGVVIGCENSPLSTTLSGDSVGVDSVLQRLREESRGVFARRLRTEHAYHSRKLQTSSPLTPEILVPVLLLTSPDSSHE